MPPRPRRSPSSYGPSSVRAGRGLPCISMLQRSAELPLFLIKIKIICGSVWTTVLKVSEERTISYRGAAAPLPVRKASGDVLRVSGKRRVVAITGAATFLGLNLIGLLEDDPRVAKIVCLDTTSPPTVGAKSRYYELDLVHPAAEERLAEVFGAEGVDTVVHLGLL